MAESYSIEVTTQIGCRNMCAYCPQERLVRRYLAHSRIRQLSIEAFARCLDHVPPASRIYFSGFAEPWLNPRCTDMVEQASRRGFPVFVFSTAQGMTVADVERLRQIGLGARPCIHLPDDQGYTRFQVTEAYVRVLAELRRAFPDAEYVCPVFDPDKAGLHPRLQGLFRKVARSQCTTPAPDDGRSPVSFYAPVGRANQVAHVPAMPSRFSRGRLGLCLRIAGPVLLPSGDLVLCCSDYSLQHVIGNLLADDLCTILRQPQYLRVLRGLTDESEPILCRRCEYAPMPEQSDTGVLERLSLLYAGHPELLALLPMPDRARDKGQG